MTTEPELVVLVDEEGIPTGAVEKFAVHTANTPLHLAFSCHVYNDNGQVLVTRRALSKITWPGVWTNSFCGHPTPGETLDDAIARRARVELGITVSELEPLLPAFRYRAVDASGIVENEICPVFRAVTTDAIEANLDEVSEWKWVDPAAVAAAITAAPFAFSPWYVLQNAELSA
ncbi:MAG: isopentenyl-diphosphate Delta-isomerase [Microbacteriaceae bacterium]|nr:isopentenyl-diphosphate Delta-isomerase [Microbacteriaceae bacterium]